MKYQLGDVLGSGLSGTVRVATKKVVVGTEQVKRRERDKRGRSETREERRENLVV